MKRTLTALATLCVASLMCLSPAAAGEDDLNCGDPGTTPNMSVPPGDPDGLDGDGNGIGCEDDTASPGDTVAVPTTAPAADAEPQATNGEPQTLPRTGASSTTMMTLGGAGLLGLGVLAIAGRRRLVERVR